MHASLSLHRWKLSCHSTLNYTYRAKTSLNNTEKQRTTITIPVLLFLHPVNLQTITNIIFWPNFSRGSEYVNSLAVLATRTTTATNVWQTRCDHARNYKTVEWGNYSEPERQSLRETFDDRSVT
jgi:hypothetical protein